MKKLSIPLALLAAATLAACGTNETRPSAADSAYYISPVPNAALRTGPGKVAELLDPTGPVNGISWQRMTLKMDDGTSQIVDRRGPQVALGEHLRVRSDGSFKRDPNETRATP